MRESRAEAGKAAVLALAAERGDVTLDELARAAGVSRMTLWRWRDQDPGFAAALDGLRDARIADIEDNVLAEIARRTTPDMLRAMRWPYLVQIAAYLDKARRRVARVELSGQVGVAATVDADAARAVLADAEAVRLVHDALARAAAAGGAAVGAGAAAAPGAGGRVSGATTSGTGGTGPA